MGTILLILSNTQYFLGVDTAFTKQYTVRFGVDTANTKHHALFSLLDTAFMKKYALYPLVDTKKYTVLSGDR